MNRRTTPALNIDQLPIGKRTGSFCITVCDSCGGSNACGVPAMCLSSPTVCVSFIAIPDLFARRQQPSVIYSPVFAQGFDCYDLSMMLSSLGFEGKYRAISNALPNPGLVRDEVLSVCPDLNFDVVTAPSNAKLHLI